MLLGKQSDVKKHLSSLHHKTLHLVPAVGPPDATDTSLTGPDAIDAKSDAFAKDYTAEHKNPGQAATPAADSTGLIDTQSSKASKSVQP